MKVSTLEGHFSRSLGYLCVYILFGMLALIKRLCLTILRYHSVICASEVYVFLADFDELTLPPVVLLCD